MLITIVMPCLNEERAMGRTIEEIPCDTLREMDYVVEVLVIDGGSSDRSVDLARSKGARVLVSERGYGRQCRFGFEHASGEIIVNADSDGSYPLSDVPRIVETLRSGGFDFVTLNRFANVSPGAMPLLNNIGNTLLTSIMNFLFRLKIKDSQSGMWAIRKEALKGIDLTSDGMALSEEIKIEAFRKVKSIEVPGSYKHRIGPSKLRLCRDGWRNLSFLVTKWRKERQNR